MESKKFIGISFGLLLSSFSAWYFYNNYKGNNEDEVAVKGNSIPTNEQILAEQRRKENEKRFKFTCNYLDQMAQKNPDNRFNKEAEIEKLKMLFACSYINKDKFTKDHSLVCEEFLNYKENISQYRFIIRRLLNDIYKNVCSFKIEDNKSDSHIKVLKNKFEKLGFNTNVDPEKISILNPNTEAKQICEKALDIVISNPDDLREIITYLLSKKTKIKEGSKLSDVIKRFEERVKKHNTTPTDLIKRDLGWASKAANSRGVSEWFNVCSYSQAKDIINNYRKDVVEIINETLELVINETGEEDKKIKDVLLRIAIQLNKQ